MRTQKEELLKEAKDKQIDRKTQSCQVDSDCDLKVETAILDKDTET